MQKTIHQGRNIKRFREMLGIKQESLAATLGADWNQKKISPLEAKELIDEPLLEEVAAALKVPVEAIENFDEDAAVNIIANTIDNGAIGYQRNESCTFHPVDKLIQLHEEKIALYERMLKEKDEMMERLERMMRER